MRYPAKENKENKAKYREDILNQLGKIYDTSSDIDEYKVNRDIKCLKCPTLIDAFIIYYLACNYGRNLICACMPIISGIMISTIVCLIGFFFTNISCGNIVLLSFLFGLMCMFSLAWYAQYLYAIGYKYTS